MMKQACILHVLQRLSMIKFPKKNWNSLVHAKHFDILNSVVSFHQLCYWKKIELMFYRFQSYEHPHLMQSGPNVKLFDDFQSVKFTWNQSYWNSHFTTNSFCLPYLAFIVTPFNCRNFRVPSLFEIEILLLEMLCALRKLILYLQQNWNLHKCIQ